MSNQTKSSWTGRKKTILVVVSALLVFGVLVGFAGPMAGGGGGGAGPAAQGSGGSMRTTTLEKGDLRSAVSATGTVYSVESVNVYSNLSYAVGAVHVSVGDTVSQGDVLARLDTASLESDIAQKQAQVSSSQATARQNVATAQQDLATYQQNLEQNLDSSLLSAEKAVSSAESSLAAAQLELESANTDLSTARRKRREAQEDDDYDSDSSEYRDLVADVAKKEVAVEKAQNTVLQRESELENARASLEAAKNSSGETLQSYQNKVTSAQLNNNFNADYISIQKLQGDLENCVITAPVSGTVTAVNAIVGASGNGLLFVIQNTQELKVVTNIKEYDIGSVTIGDRVIIKTDATGDREFEGTLSRIAPTSTLTTTGETTSSTDAEFEAEVAVGQGAAGLLIGMNARLSIITEERQDVFSVPFEAVETANGESFIYVLTAGEGGNTLERIPVETGLESNLYVEISGQGLAQGMQVVKNASTADQSLVTEGGGQMPEGGEQMPEGGGQMPEGEPGEVAP